MRLLPDTLKAHACRNRERCAKPRCEKADCRRYPQHTLAPDPEQDELDLQPGENGHA